MAALLAALLSPAGRAVSALLLAGALLGAAYEYGRHEGRAGAEAEARAAALDLIEKRNRDDAEISGMDLRRLCLELGGQWVREQCD